MQTTEKWLLAAALIAGGGLFAKLMYDMAGDMRRMSVYVGEMNASMRGMAADVGRMAQTMETIQASMQRMDQTIHRGSEQLQQWNPMEMMTPRR